MFVQNGMGPDGGEGFDGLIRFHGGIDAIIRMQLGCGSIGDHGEGMVGTEDFLEGLDEILVTCGGIDAESVVCGERGDGGMNGWIDDCIPFRIDVNEMWSIIDAGDARKDDAAEIEEEQRWIRHLKGGVEKKRFRMNFFEIIGMMGVSVLLDLERNKMKPGIRTKPRTRLG